MAYGPATYIAVSLILLVTVWLAVSLRLYSRIILQPGPFADDIFTIGSTVVYTVFAVLFVYGAARCGLGRHMSELSEQTRTEGMKVFLIIQLLYVVGTLLVKISFTLTLYRIVQTKIHRYVLHLLIITGVIVTSVEFFYVLLACRPISLSWQYSKAIQNIGGSCRSLGTMQAVNMTHGGWIIVADLVLGLIIPGMLLHGLQMNYKTKMSVLFLLGLGSLTIIATSIRLPYVFRVTFEEPLYSNPPAILWAMVEISVSIISIAAATLKPMLLKIGIMTKSGNRSTEGTNRISLPQRSAHKWHQLAVYPSLSQHGSMDQCSSTESRV